MTALLRRGEFLERTDALEHFRRQTGFVQPIDKQPCRPCFQHRQPCDVSGPRQPHFVLLSEHAGQSHPRKGVISNPCALNTTGASFCAFIVRVIISRTTVPESSPSSN